MAAAKPSPMELWNKVCDTDPAICKKVQSRGGFTSIDAQSQIKMATEIWGPYGMQWGLRDLNWGELRNMDQLEEITLSALFFYPGGSFEMGDDIAYRVGGDCRKKLQTDITTKALSKLGFNSDVFEGKFDDAKYVDEQKKKHGAYKAKAETAPRKPAPKADAPKPPDKPAHSAEHIALWKQIRETGKVFGYKDEAALRDLIARPMKEFGCDSTNDLSNEQRTKIRQWLVQMAIENSPPQNDEAAELFD